MNARLCGGNSRRLLVEPFGDGDFVQFDCPITGFHVAHDVIVLTTADRMLMVIRHEYGPGTRLVVQAQMRLW